MMLSFLVWSEKLVAIISDVELTTRCYHSWRGVKILLLSFLVWRETRCYHLWRGVKRIAIIPGVELKSLLSFLAWC